MTGTGDACTPTQYSDYKNLGRSCSSVGNPVNCGTGNKYLVEADYRAVGLFPLRFVRSYNSLLMIDTAGIGAQWRHTYAARINVVSPTQVRAYRADGRMLVFNLVSGSWVPDADIEDRLQRVLNPQGQTLEWRYTVAASEELERFDAAGRLQRIEDRAGRALILTYGPSPAFRLQSVSDGLGRALSFTHDASGRISTMTDPAGGVFTYTYDSAGLLVEVIHPDTRTKTYHYNEAAFTAGASMPPALTGITDERGIRLATYRYDSAGMAISTELAGAVNRYQVSYPSASQRTITDPLGVSRTYGFMDLAGMPYNTSITGPVCPSCGPAARTYDANGNLASTTDWNGFRTTYTFDLARNLETSRTEGLNGNGTARAETRTIQTEWHPTFRLPTKITERNRSNVALRETTMVYDTLGNLVSRTVRDVPTGQLRTWTWRTPIRPRSPA